MWGWPFAYFGCPTFRYAQCTQNPSASWWQRSSLRSSLFFSPQIWLWDYDVMRELNGCFPEQFNQKNVCMNYISNHSFHIHHWSGSYSIHSWFKPYPWPTTDAMIVHQHQNDGHEIRKSLWMTGSPTISGSRVCVPDQSNQKPKNFKVCTLHVAQPKIWWVWNDGGPHTWEMMRTSCTTFSFDYDR